MNKNLGSTDRKLRAFVVAPVLVVVGLLVGPLGWLTLVAYAGCGHRRHRRPAPR
jgi:hypothetical protein